MHYSATTQEKLIYIYFHSKILTERKSIKICQLSRSVNGGNKPQKKRTFYKTRYISGLQEAMYSILDEIKEGDRFNIITFGDMIKTYKPDMIDATKQEILDAKTYTRGIDANGCKYKPLLFLIVEMTRCLSVSKKYF